MQVAQSIPFFNWGMAENLVSEILGILVTVFIVDWLFRRRDSKRLRPTRRFFYLRLLKLVDDFLLGTSNLHRRTPKIVVKFGDHRGFRTHDYSDVTDWQISKSWRPLLPTLETSAEARKHKKTSLGLQKYTNYWTYLLVEKRELEDRFLPFIEPDLLNMLAVAEHELLTVTLMAADNGRALFRELNEERMGKTLRCLFDIHIYLVKHSDSSWTV